MGISRRVFLGSTSAAILLPSALSAKLRPDPRMLDIESRVLDIKGKAAKAYRLQEQGSNEPGLHFNMKDPLFSVRLTNKTDAPELIHWHGLTPPNAQDGVPHVTQAPLSPGAFYDYNFMLRLPGTNWMHTHHSIKEQLLMAAPLIIHDPDEEGLDEQEITVMIHDFTFKDPNEVLADLKNGMAHNHAVGQNGAGAPAMDMTSMMIGHLNDVEFDAFLMNDRTLDDPAIYECEKNQSVRLRLINAASSTNFWIDLGNLEGMLIAVDGRPIHPQIVTRFPLAMAQRADIRIRTPKEDGVWPILAEREGDTIRTGFILRSGRADIKKISDRHDRGKTKAVDLSMEAQIGALTPLAAKPTDRKLTLDLAGSMMNFVWALESGSSPEQFLSCQNGERVEIEMVNRTDMLHPMHLHGHHFQVVEIDGKRLNGAMRDTVIVPVGGRVTIAFDADNPGRWMFHCHNLYHMLAGMMTELRYS